MSSHRDGELLVKPAELYRAIGGAHGCRELARAFYSHVEQDPILRPFFPSTFTCAIEEVSAYLVTVSRGRSRGFARRGWISLHESHSRFTLGPRERSAWQAMSATLGDEVLIADAGIRHGLLEFFKHSALHMAARRGNAEVIAALLDEGADIEAPDRVGETALRRSVNLDKVEAARLLFERGADAGSVGSKGLTPRLAARSRQMKQLLAR